MPPVPIYASSPITAAKASGVTPQTAGSDSAAAKSSGPAPTPTTPQAYPAAQPGATPHLPKQTGAPSASYLPPTQTQNPSAGPPAPQPGAVPSVSGLPPPPKTGEAYHPPQQTPDPQATTPSNQRAAHAASVRENGPLDGSEEGVWEAAKKWASTAGGNLAAAETEIWRRINKN
ncbi:NADP-specific glutamate dehydrogenase [Verticillium dahliae VDG1]|nr:NADP-specific glutamate dehydrogenase [Verticillium dahliae VDG1]